MKKIIIIGLLLITFSFLQGCSTSDTISPSAYPVKVVASSTQEGYPVSTNPPIIASTKVQDPNMGMVTGVLLINGQPNTLTVMYLADVLSDEKTGVELATSLDRNSAPQAIVDEAGKFVFNNVPPGRYGLMLLDGIDVYLLLNPSNSQEAILLTVETGDTVDIGILDYLELPTG